jgi:hypothetical protein
LDNWFTFEPFARRFCKTFKEFSPGYENYKLVVAVNGGNMIDDIALMFYGIRTQFVDYDGCGCDIGSAQFVSHRSLSGDFILAMTSRCYFHREGWLRRYMEAREKHGSGLYGASASHEGGTPHICTRAYAMDASLWCSYPHIIDTREKGQKFETGEFCLTTWAFGKNLPTMQVTWDGEQDEKHWRDPQHTGIYRRGNQNEMLVWDKHSDAFRDASPEEKVRLSKMADSP